MAKGDHLPIIVGVGQVNDRSTNPLDAIDPVALMAEALRLAEADCGVSLLADADTLDIVRQISFPHIENASLPLARAIGASRALLSQTEGPTGDSPVRLLNDAANRIGAGEITIALVCGGEALRTAAARVAATEDGRKLDTLREARHRVRTGYAADHGLVAPVDVYPLYENAMRAAFGQTYAEAQAETGAMWSLFSHVAASNPHAWLREPVSAETVVTPGIANRPIAFPYTKLQVANSSVNQGAGFIVTSVSEARRRGIPEGKWIYVGNGARACEPTDVLARDRFDRSVSLEVSLLSALDLNGIRADAVDAVELYSCFPCIPKLARRVIEWPLDRPASVFGGLTFGGGPVGNYMSHAIASMVERLRSRGGMGLLFGNGGIATNNHTVIVSRDPIAAATFPRSYDVQAQADASRAEPPPLDQSYEGPATVETWTVHYDRNEMPRSGVIVARTPDGARTLSHLTAHCLSALAAIACSGTEFVGSAGRIVFENGRRIWKSGA